MFLVMLECGRTQKQVARCSNGSLLTLLRLSRRVTVTETFADWLRSGGHISEAYFSDFLTIIQFLIMPRLNSEERASVLAMLECR